MLLAALMVLLGEADQTTTVGFVPAVIAAFFVFVTGVLLVADLKKPSRFYLVLTRGNWSSWLVRGAYILGLYALLLGGWLLAALLESPQMFVILAVPIAVVAVSTAGYTAFLFAQCEGRDLWQSQLLLPMLLVQAVAAGGSVWFIADLFVDMPESLVVRGITMAALVANGLLVILEISGDHSRHVALAVHSMTRGDQRKLFLTGIIGGLVLPVILLSVGWMIDSQASTLPCFAGILILGGMWAYEDSYVQAGQSVPLS
jgi:formate-dependent nitrite reductase membrane component NrfD